MSTRWPVTPVPLAMSCSPALRRGCLGFMNDFFDEIENRRQAAVVQFLEDFVNHHFAALEHAADAHFGHSHHHAAGIQAA